MGLVVVMRPRFAIALTAVCLLLAGCHNSWQVAGGIWYVTSQECADGTTGVWINSPSLSGSGMYGTTGAFRADSQGCHPKPMPAGYVQVMVDLYKQNAGLCVPGSGWHGNPDESYAALTPTDPIDFICGTGNYFALGTNYVNLVDGPHTHWTNSPGDHYG